MRVGAGQPHGPGDQVGALVEDQPAVEAGAGDAHLSLVGIDEIQHALDGHRLAAGLGVGARRLGHAQAPVPALSHVVQVGARLGGGRGHEHGERGSGPRPRRCFRAAR